MSIKGMASVLPADVQKWRYLERVLLQGLQAHDFAEIRLPLVTEKALLQQTMESSTIVTKEMFGLSPPADKLVLRPEGTAMCAALLLQHGFFRHQQPLKVWYYGPMFRYEQPQKGRLRQFHQLGIESFQLDAPLQEMDILAVTWYLWQQLQLQDHLTLEINNIGTRTERTRYLADLALFFQQCHLTPDQQLTLAQNPLRLLETKEPLLQAQLHAAPLIQAYYTREQQIALDQLLAYAHQLGIPVRVNPLLVRGLDYYGGNVFEWRIQNVLGAQDTVCAGGRYDALLQQCQRNTTVTAFGCAFGIERILLALETLQLLPVPVLPWTVYLFSDSASATLAFTLRTAMIQRCPQVRIILNWQSKKLQAHFEKGVYCKARLLIQLAAGQLAYTFPPQQLFQSITAPVLLMMLETAYNLAE